MNAKGLRIHDCKEENVLIDFSTILDLVGELNTLIWTVYSFESGIIKEKFEDQYEHINENINESVRGLVLNWDGLENFNSKFYQFIDAVFIGCKNIDVINRKMSEQELLETCEVVMTVFDSSFWEVFTNDENFYNRLLSKFNQIEPLETNFLEHEYD